MISHKLWLTTMAAQVVHNNQSEGNLQRCTHTGRVLLEIDEPGLCCKINCSFIRIHFACNEICNVSTLRLVQGQIVNVKVILRVIRFLKVNVDWIISCVEQNSKIINVRIDFTRTDIFSKTRFSPISEDDNFECLLETFERTIDSTSYDLIIGGA